MESRQVISKSTQTGGETRLNFDQYLEQLPASKQSTHRVLGTLIIAAIVLTLGVFVYSIYASFTWKTVGGSNVVLAWLYFFSAGALAAFVLGMETLILGSTIPPPFGSTQRDFEPGRKATLEGWSLVGYGVVVTALVIVGVTAVRSWEISVENMVTLIVGAFAILGLGSGALAILRRFQQSGKI